MLNIIISYIIYELMINNRLYGKVYHKIYLLSLCNFLRF